MMPRVLAPLLALLLSAAGPTLAGQTEFGQSLPIPLPGPLTDMLANPSHWLITTFDDVLAEVGRRTTTDEARSLNVSSYRWPNARRLNPIVGATTDAATRRRMRVSPASRSSRRRSSSRVWCGRHRNPPSAFSTRPCAAATKD